MNPKLIFVAQPLIAGAMQAGYRSWKGASILDKYTLMDAAVTAGVTLGASTVAQIIRPGAKQEITSGSIGSENMIVGVTAAGTLKIIASYFQLGQSYGTTGDDFLMAAISYAASAYATYPFLTGIAGAL
jgi:hypothetical protein